MKRAFHPLAMPPDLVSALRATVAFTAALAITSAVGVPLAGQFAATTALGISLPQLRGAYHIRVLVLLVLIGVISASAFMGALAAGNTGAAVAGIGVLALLSGLWRHLSSDYGVPLGVDSGLLFLLALEGPSHGATPGQIGTWAAMGGLGAGLLHLGIWLFRPQHPLRHAVAESWVAVSDLFLAMRPVDSAGTTADLLAQKQRGLRETLDRTSKTLAVPSKQSPGLLQHLDQMRHEAAHFAMKVTAFHTASEPLRNNAASAMPLATLDSLLEEMANLARSVAITLMTHRPENLGITEARLQTCERMMRVLEEQLLSCALEEGTVTPMRHLLAGMREELAHIDAGLIQTSDPSLRQTRVLFHLPDLSGKSIHSLAAWLNPSPTVDPGLVRYAIRMAVLCMAAVAVYRLLEIPRGYWIAFAIIVVLQPDYGSTRQRAAQRVGGTFAGALLGSGLLLISLPVWLMGVLSGLTAFCFAYFLKQRYGLAVFFVTLMLVLITELHAPVHLDFTIGRLLSNLAGAAIALIAAMYFWPSWEREKFPPLLAGAIRANNLYLQAVAEHPTSSQSFGSTVVPAKQKAERTGLIATASLQRLLTEPRRQQTEAQRRWAVSAVTCNERITRAISVLASHLVAGSGASSLRALDISEASAAVRAALEDAAKVVEEDVPFTRQAKRGLTALASADTLSRPTALTFSLEKLTAETQGLVVALSER